MYDVIIIGGGPAAAGAAVYTARKKLRTLLITESFGGQSVVSADVQNWIGTKSISGFDLAQALEAHVRNFPDDIEVKSPELAVKADKIEGGFAIETNKNAIYEGKTLIIASGARRRKLGVPGEKELDGRGVAYCATCDAPLFAGKDVAVVGGGNAGLESVIDLFPYAKHIYLLEYSSALKGDPITQEKIKHSEKVTIIYNAGVLAILGEKFMTGLKYKDLISGEEKELPVGGVFVEIGSLPNSDFIKDMVETNNIGEIVINHKTSATSTAGIWAAGDVTDEMYKQNNISAGDGVKAALSAYNYLISRRA